MKLTEKQHLHIATGLKNTREKAKEAKKSITGTDEGSMFSKRPKRKL